MVKDSSKENMQEKAKKFPGPSTSGRWKQNGDDKTVQWPDMNSTNIELPVEIGENDIEENVLNAVEYLSDHSCIKKNVRKRIKNVQKRMMCRMADTNFIFGSEIDTLFTQSEPKIVETIQLTNHATRTYLATKFLRRNKMDFEVAFKSNYSLLKIYSLLDVSETSIRRLVKTLPENESWNDFMKRNKFMSSVELNPRSHEQYFKRYAINYDALKNRGLFDKQK